jgi:phage antirepressor YoqD-like protein
MKNQLFSVAQTAQLVKFPGGEKQFFAWLRAKKYLKNDNFPYQRYVDMGWFETHLATLHKTKDKRKVPVTLVDINGLYFLKKAVMKEFPPCTPCYKSNKNGK